MQRVQKQGSESENAQRTAQAKFTSWSRENEQTNVIDGSPAMIAQRKKLNSLFGGAIQRQGAEEEMLQGKFDTAQRVEEEEPLQGKFETAQRVEEEEPLQGKFETAQRVEEEDLLQGKFETAQRVEEEEPLQGKFEAVQRAEEEELLQGKFEAASSTQLKEVAKPNNTGLPDNLKSGIESLSGMSMDNVKVHYNSSQPAQLNALAYAQGTDIHVAPGQEQHLPHEAWHVVQQAQGRVKPTMQMKEGVPVNDDRSLEHEADVMGAKAMQLHRSGKSAFESSTHNSDSPVQRILREKKKNGDYEVIEPESQAGFINLYATFMSQDLSVLVDGKTVGRASVISVLKETAVDGASVHAELQKSVMTSKAYAEITNATLKTSLAEHIAEQMNSTVTDIGGEDEVIGTAGYTEVTDWVDEKLEPLDSAKTVGEIAAVTIPIQWHEDMAQIVYDLTKEQFYGQEEVIAQPYVPPFKALIKDVDDGEIEEFKFVRKYGQNTVPGAEFTVEAPDEKKTEYSGKAVLHTHYPSDTDEPNYAHTKPEAQKYSPGFGYTTVKLAEVKKVDDSKKSFDAL
ncbi:MAG: DUF4157 domain-containing protein [Gallionella sp.]|nr:DUF4157 domain-containing protein [Gallionella sp.]MCK9352574.1 DUF4157 domain-containing protein [Gallionella sp.]